MNSTVGALPRIAYQIATEPNFLDRLRLLLNNTFTDLHGLNSDEQSALQNLLQHKELAQLLQVNSDDAPLEGYWWYSA